MRRITALAALMLAATHVTRADDLGPAEAYNVFILGNDTQQYTDAEGKVAVGGTANFLGYSVLSSPYSGQSTANALVVGGNSTLGNMTVAGDYHYGGTYTNTGGATITGTTTHDSPIDFASASSTLNALSVNLATLSANGTVAQNNGANGQPSGLTLTGTGSGLNVFNLTAAQLSSANSNGLNIVSPTGSTVVINVAGASPSLANFQMYVNGSSSETNPLINNILFNFSQATSLTDSSATILGSVLAPKAALHMGYEHIDGTLIGASMAGLGTDTVGHIEAHNYKFGGTLPSFSVTTSAVPEPASILMVLTGLAGGLGVWRKQRRVASA